MRDAVRSYRDLQVWQRAMTLVVHCYRHTELFPRSELYGLTGQLRRAAVSIPSNIAEGHERQSPKEFLHHLSIASGSLAELETQIELAMRLNDLVTDDAESLLLECTEVGRMLGGLRKAVRARINAKREDTNGP